MKKQKPKYRNAIISDCNELSKLESNIFAIDKVNTNFYKEIHKESKKIFICSYENHIKENIYIYSKIY